MTNPVLEAAEALSGCLPALQSLRGKTIVVKYGGNAMTDPECRVAVLRDIALLQTLGIRLILVHGGGPDISRTMKALGIENRFVDGLRVTDEAVMKVVRMALAGEVNTTLTAQLHAQGAPAVGLTGADAGLIEAEAASAELGLVGRVTKVRTELLETMLEQDLLPVIASVAVDSAGTTYNVNADTAASAVAQALRADKLILMTNTDGLLTDPADPSTRLSRITAEDVRRLTDDGVIAGGMIPKTACACDALAAGVGSVVIINGTRPHSLVAHLLAGSAFGTVICRTVGPAPAS